MSSKDERWADAKIAQLTQGGVSFDWWSVGEMEAPSIRDLLIEAYDAGDLGDNERDLERAEMKRLSEGLNETPN